MNTSNYRQCKQCGEYFHADQDWKHICIGCFKDNKRKEREREAGQQKYNQHRQYSPPAKAIPPDMLRILIMLAHPDKHGGKAIATQATQWLLAQRDTNGTI